jgi:hypothetical protein
MLRSRRAKRIIDILLALAVSFLLGYGYAISGITGWKQPSTPTKEAATKRSPVFTGFAFGVSFI